MAHPQHSVHLLELDSKLIELGPRLEASLAAISQFIYDFGQVLGPEEDSLFIRIYRILEPFRKIEAEIRENLVQLFRILWTERPLSTLFGTLTRELVGLTDQGRTLRGFAFAPEGGRLQRQVDKLGPIFNPSSDSRLRQALWPYVLGHLPRLTLYLGYICKLTELVPFQERATLDMLVLVLCSFYHPTVTPSMVFVKVEAYPGDESVGRVGFSNYPLKASRTQSGILSSDEVSFPSGEIVQRLQLTSGDVVHLRELHRLQTRCNAWVTKCLGSLLRWGNAGERKIAHVNRAQSRTDDRGNILTDSREDLCDDRLTLQSQSVDAILEHDFGITSDESLELELELERCRVGRLLAGSIHQSHDPERSLLTARSMLALHEFDFGARINRNEAEPPRRDFIAAAHRLASSLPGSLPESEEDQPTDVPQLEQLDRLSRTLQGLLLSEDREDHKSPSLEPILSLLPVLNLGESSTLVPEPRMRCMGERIHRAWTVRRQLDYVPTAVRICRELASARFSAITPGDVLAGVEIELIQCMQWLRSSTHTISEGFGMQLYLLKQQVWSEVMHWCLASDPLVSDSDVIQCSFEVPVLLDALVTGAEKAFYTDFLPVCRAAQDVLSMFASIDRDCRHQPEKYSCWLRHAKLFQCSGSFHLLTALQLNPELHEMVNIFAEQFVAIALLDRDGRTNELKFWATSPTCPARLSTLSKALLDTRNPEDGIGSVAQADPSHAAGILRVWLLTEAAPGLCNEIAPTRDQIAMLVRTLHLVGKGVTPSSPDGSKNISAVQDWVPLIRLVSLTLTDIETSSESKSRNE